MSQTFQCGDNAALIGYLYNECEPLERSAIATHVAVCPACTAELAALESTRIQLEEWRPPEVELGFMVSRPQARSASPREGAALKALNSSDREGLSAASYRRPLSWFNRPLPAWAQAVAASLIFAAGLWLGIARGGASLTAARSATVEPQPVTNAVSTQELTDLERRLRAEIADIRAARSTTAASGPHTTSEAQLLARVSELIADSERRQQNQLAMRTAQVVRDFDTQRRADLTQIQNSFGQIEGLTGAEVREQRQMLNYLMRVSQQR